MSYEFIMVERKDRVGLITLNRPKQLNALNVRCNRKHRLLGRAAP